MHYKCLMLLIAELFIMMPNGIDSARILAMFHLKGKSHFFMFEVLLKELAARGHQVDVLSHYPQQVPVANYTDFSLEGTGLDVENKITYGMMSHLGLTSFVKVYWELSYYGCKLMMESEQIRNLLRSDTVYDILILEVFTNDCMMGFVHKFKAPFILLSSSYPMHWGYERMGNPDNPAHMPSYFIGLTDHMSFTERLKNTVIHVISSAINTYYMHKVTVEVGRKYFGEDMPAISEISRNTSLYLVNSHPTISYPRPLLPSIVDVGGLHIKKSRKLPKDLENFLNESEEGVIYISLGTMLRPDTLPPENLKMIIGAISELPQRALWKIAGERSIPGLTSKFKTASWFPQNDLLHHPKIRAFITHGGMMGTMEAVHAGVPMIVMPIFGDQFQNAVSYVSKGLAVQVDHDTMTKDVFLNALKSVLTNSSYRKNAQRVSRLFRDRPQPPLDTAVYWVEHVIRYRGASHLRSAALDLPLHEYLLVDVLAALVLIVLTVLAALWYIADKIWRITKRNFKKLKKS